MTKSQRENISRLIEKVSRRTSTEDLIAFVADNFGMLDACRKVVGFREAAATEERTWFEQQCHDLRIAPPVLQNECERILSIFQPGLAEDEQYSLLGLTPLASIAEVKSAYHKLSFRYHPDSAADDADKVENAEKFIAICRAYKKISQAQENLNAGAGRAENIPWQHEARPRHQKPRQQKRKAIFLIAAIAVFLLIISFTATHHYRKQAMLKSLSQSSGTVAAVKSRPRPLVVASKPVKVAKAAAPAAAAKSEKSQSVKIAATVAPDTAAKSAKPEKPQPVKVAAAISPAPTPQSVPAPRPAPDKVKVKTAVPVPAPRSEPVKAKPAVSLPAPKTSPPPVKVAVSTPPAAPKSVKKASTPPRPRKPEPVQAASVTRPPQPRKTPKKSQLKPHAVPPAKPISPKKVAHKAKPTPPPVKVATATSVAVAKPVAVAAPKPKPAAVSTPAPKTVSLPPLRDRVNTFINAYTDTYERLNFNAFAALFTDDAKENNTLFKQRTAKYHKLFARLKEVSYTIKPNSLRVDDNLVYVSGRFNASLRYRDGKELNLHGPTSLLLREDQTHHFKVKNITYTIE